MTASVGFLAIMVTVALMITAAAPVLLLYFLYRDWEKGTLW